MQVLYKDLGGGGGGFLWSKSRGSRIGEICCSDENLIEVETLLVYCGI